jgi:hypothetical protein
MQEQDAALVDQVRKHKLVAETISSQQYANTIYAHKVMEDDRLVYNFLIANKRKVEDTVLHIIRMMVRIVNHIHRLIYSRIEMET